MTPDVYAAIRLTLFVALGFGAGLLTGFAIAALMVAGREEERRDDSR